MQKTLFLIFILFIVSCSKSSTTSQPKTDPKLTGKWVWVESTATNNPDSLLTGMNTGIYKMLAFGADGSLSVFHNDSTMQYGELHVYFFSTLIPQILEEKKNYQIKTESAGCYNDQITFLVVDSAQNYQYNVSNDTLYISNPPCLAPVSSAYLKVQ